MSAALPFDVRRLAVATVVGPLALMPLVAHGQAPASGGAVTGARVVYKQQDPTTGRAESQVTIDVFWCSGDGAAGNRALAASELAASYATLASLRSSGAAEEIREVRTRPIASATFLTGLDPADAAVAAHRPLLRFDASEHNLQGVEEDIISKGIHPVATSQMRSAAYAPNYASVFVCTDLDKPAVSGRLFFQVKDATMASAALKAAAAVRKDLPGLFVANDVEVVGAKSPELSELRYFFPADSGLASSLAT